jgi:hypothetical protein
MWTEGIYLVVLVALLLAVCGSCGWVLFAR